MRGEQKALNLCWAYAVLFAPTFFWLNSYEPLTTFFILASLLMIRRNRIVFTALAIGLGVLTKFLSLLMLPVVWRIKGWKGVVTTGAISLGLVLLIFAPLYFFSPIMTSASISAHLNHSPSNTIWGLLQNRANLVKNPAIHDHIEPKKASQPLNGPESWPLWPVYIPFAALGVYFLISPRLAPGYDEIIITTLLFSLLFLASPDWNPHWQLFYIPLLLLAFPIRRALLHVVTLSAVNLLESPLLASRNLIQLLPLTIIARTLILVLIVIELAIILAKASRIDVKPEVAA
jgi:hypothetical protein